MAFRWYFGSVSLNFVGTRGHRRTEAPIERLAGPERLAAWLNEAELLSVVPAVHDADWREALALREAIWTVADTLRSGTSANREAIALINAAARRQPIIPQLDAETRELTRTGEPPVRAALATIARDAVEVFAGPRAAAIRACEGVDCGGLYVDDSRGRRRRWCSMERCGNAAKVAAFRTRNR